MKYLMLVLLALLVSIAVWIAVRSREVDSELKNKKRLLNSMLTTQKIKISDLSSQLESLVDGQTEFDCLGIHSNGIDCIYLMHENGVFNIDFEAMWEDQLPYIEQLNDYADLKQIDAKMTTYGNTPHYKSDSTASVLQLKTNASLEAVVEIARSIQSDVFGNDEDTVYEVVP